MVARDGPKATNLNQANWKIWNWIVMRVGDCDTIQPDQRLQQKWSSSLHITAGKWTYSSCWCRKQRLSTQCIASKIHLLGTLEFPETFTGMHVVTENIARRTVVTGHRTTCKHKCSLRCALTRDNWNQTASPVLRRFFCLIPKDFQNASASRMERQFHHFDNNCPRQRESSCFPWHRLEFLSRFDLI